MIEFRTGLAYEVLVYIQPCYYSQRHWGSWMSWKEGNFFKFLLAPG